MSIYQIGRKFSGLSQESAAELLGCASRTLSGYENDVDDVEMTSTVPDEVAARMAQIYNMPLLALWHMKYYTKCGAFMPDIVEPRTCGDVGFQAYLSHQDTLSALHLATNLLQDGKITPDEYGDARKLSNILKLASGRCLSSAAFIDGEYAQGNGETKAEVIAPDTPRSLYKVLPATGTSGFA